MPTTRTSRHRSLLLGIATALGCAGYLETVDEQAPECDERDAACRAAPERGVLVVPDARPAAREVPTAAPPNPVAEPANEAADPSVCPPGSREVPEPEGSCGAVACEPIPAHERP